MRILFVLENYYPNVGGVETLFKSLAESLANDGHQITVLTNRFSKDLKPRETLNKVNIIRPSLYNRYLFTLLAFFPIILQGRKHDLIHTTSYNAGLPSILAGLVIKKKVIITFHEVWGELWYKLPYFGRIPAWTHSTFEKLLLKLPFTKFIAVSKFTADRLYENGISEDKMVQIYNGINYDKMTTNLIPNEPKNNRFLFFGRLGISKGIDLLIKSFSILKNENIKAELDLIIPNTPESFYNTIVKEIEEHQLNDLININPSLPYEKLKQKIQLAYAIIIPSYSEGFCYAAVESIALGARVISSDQGALKEVISGEYIKMDELSAESLAHAIKKALNCEWHKSKVKQFHLEKTIKEYSLLYNQLLA